MIARRDERTNTAYHEAGHCVIRLAVGLSFDRVTLEPTPCVWVGDHELTGPLLPVRLATSHMAGAAAVAILTDMPDDRADTDCFNALKVLKLVADDPEFAAGHAFDTAMALLHERWHSVCVIAEALLRKGALDYLDVRRLCGC